MLNRIIRFSLHHRLLIVMAAVLLAIAGSISTSRTEVDVFPDLNAPTVAIMTEAGGMAPEEVERLITYPIETAVNGAAGVRRVRSSSTTGFSIVWVEFDWDTDIYIARQTVAEKLAAVRDELPAEAGNPTMGPQSSILGEVMIVALTADSTSLRDLRTMADYEIRPRLLSTGGVAQVSVLGGDVKEYQILLSPERMRHYEVSLGEVAAAVEGFNRNTSGGVLYEYGNEYLIRAILSTDRIDDLRQALVRNTPDGPVTLESVAEIRVGDRLPRTGTAAKDGREAVILTVTKQPRTGTIELTEALDRTLAEVQTTLPRDVKIETDVYRQSRFIENSIRNVRNALIEGGIFVVLVLFLFLMNFRTTLISVITIPLALLISLIALHCMGLTINTMSLGGLCIAIGSLVDDAIVDVENVFRRLRENRALPPGRQRTRLSVIYDASREVRMPILNSTLIIVAGFLPLFFLSGMEGRMLRPLGIAFIVALCASTLVALTLTPVLCSYVLERGKRRKSKRQESAEGEETTPGSSTAQEAWVARKLKAAYRRALGACLRHYRPVLAAAGVALLVAVGLFFTLGRNFLPPFNEGSLTIGISTLPGISLPESDSLGRQAERALLEIPEVKAVGRKTGRAELDEHALGVNNSELEVPYELGDRSREELMADVRERLGRIPGINVEVGAPITHRIDAMLSGTRAAIAIKVFGPDLNRLYDYAGEIREAIADIPGLTDINVEQQVERPQLKIVPRREMLARYGISLPAFGEAVSTLLAGRTVSQVYEGNQTFDVVLKVADGSRQSIEDVRHLLLDTDSGKVELGNVADVISSVGPNTVNRENAARKVVVSANVAGRDLHGAVRDIREKVNQINLPQGYHVEYGGQFESEQAASRTLLIASVFAVLIIFLLLYNQFRSARQAAVVLLNLPLALIGGILAVRMTSGIISIPAIIGFISLFGIATRNGLLLIARYNDLMARGLSPEESVLQGSTDRLNPILMTALTSALALIPMVLGAGLPGNEIQSPMAVVILGGLFTSTLLNGFVIPIMFLKAGLPRKQ